MKPGTNNVIGVGTWVEGTREGRWYRLNPRDPKSWFLFPALTLREWIKHS